MKESHMYSKPQFSSNESGRPCWKYSGWKSCIPPVTRSCDSIRTFGYCRLTAWMTLRIPSACRCMVSGTSCPWSGSQQAEPLGPSLLIGTSGGT